MRVPLYRGGDGFRRPAVPQAMDAQRVEPRREPRLVEPVEVDIIRAGRIVIPARGAEGRTEDRDIRVGPLRGLVRALEQPGVVRGLLTIHRQGAPVFL